jgi:hypothetical protein
VIDSHSVHALKLLLGILIICMRCDQYLFFYLRDNGVRNHPKPFSYNL